MRLVLAIQKSKEEADKDPGVRRAFSEKLDNLLLKSINFTFLVFLLVGRLYVFVFLLLSVFMFVPPRLVCLVVFFLSTCLSRL